MAFPGRFTGSGANEHCGGHVSSRAPWEMTSQLELPFTYDGPRFAVEYLTIAEAAQRVRCCERTIRRAIDSGTLPAGRVRGAQGSRGAWRIRLSDLDDWLFCHGA